ncbi:YesK family protein [Bacillus sp. FSL K6-3431]|uniref:YesK family protein n=1 Tax=Bacillus sp. FSL K6-3431 TaxID=2921500 RepID=UPI0030F71033
MIFGPLLIAIVLGVIILLLTSLFKKKNFSKPIRMIPAILSIIAAIILVYIAFVNIRGFEGVAYGILAFFLICIAIISFAISNNVTGTPQD